MPGIQKQIGLLSPIKEGVENDTLEIATLDHHGSTDSVNRMNDYSSPKGGDASVIEIGNKFTVDLVAVELAGQSA